VPRVIEASHAPKQILPPQDVKPVPGVAEAESLAASLPADAVTEREFEPEAAFRGTILSEPLTVVISLKDQKLDVYRGLERIETTRVSSGKEGYDTLTGVFGILQKKREHFSNLYDSAPMPYMQRLTRSGTALHAGPVPNYPASHGCVRMPYAFAPKLYRMTEIGGKVAMMTGKMVAPQAIEHPTLFDAKSEAAVPTAAVSVDAGAREAARVVADAASDKAGASAEPDVPLRILVTRREKRDIAIGVQEILASMGYLQPQKHFVGYLGNDTAKAIKAFEKDHGLPPRGHFNEKIAAKIYEAAGQGRLPDAYLFLRKGFSRVGSVPVTISNPRKNLGTHLFTFMRPSDGSEPQWIGVSLEGEDSKEVLDRITIPDDMREQISEDLTSGATLIVADTALHSSVLPEGDDFIVRTNDSPESGSEPDKTPAKVVAKPKPKTVKKRVVRAQAVRTRTRTVTRTRGFRLFSRRRR
jgi:peptidoglycan hydrolase-like protein with peptidoglycan-binding domain